jgi:hypothetical protein
VKKLLLIISTLLLLTPLFAQEEEATSSYSADFVMQFEPGLYLNTESVLVSAPSPIVYPITIGFLWPDAAVLAIQPTISFFMMQHLYYDDRALPAEIENRTTTTLSFMLNIPAVYSIFLKNSNFQITAGLGIFMRFGLLSPGVKSTDSGWSGRAGEDVSKINEYFWKKPRWFYINAGGSWLYNLTPQLRAGPVINISIPVGGLIVDKDAQGMLISVGIKICR